jgi:hypothetical protein
MLDNLRDQSSGTPFFKEEEPVPETPEQKPKKVVRRRGRRTFDQVTGTSAFQRFVLAVMLLVMVCLLGVMLLVFTGKIVLTFLY